jgi:hypothetical protein
MQRSKQQALMFLLGAVVVGGALGFSADRYMVHDKFETSFGRRNEFYDAIGVIDAKQRATLDSLAFDHGCRVRAVLAPHKATLDSIKGQFDSLTRSLLTSKQQALLDERDKESKARRKADQAKEPQKQCSGN